jgi:hypothetical protein
MGKDAMGNPRPATFDERAMRILGETRYDHIIDGETVDLRELLYKKIYNEKNDEKNELYYVLKVLKPFTATKPCIAKGGVFGYKGGALQLGLPEPLNILIGKGVLKKLTPAEMTALNLPRFPPYKDESFRPMPSTDSIYDEFVPYNDQFIPIVNEFRYNRGLPEIPLPPGIMPLAANQRIETVNPDTPRRLRDVLFGSVPQMKPLFSPIKASTTPPLSAAIGSNNNGWIEVKPRKHRR